MNTTPAAPPPVPVAPELHVLLSPQLMSDILESFIEFFAGVAVPPHFSTAAAAVIGEGEGGEGQAAAAAAEGAAAAGPALPAPSPNLVLASLQLLVRLVRDYGRANRFITAGGASSLLALPGSSAFEGSTALLAVVFRYGEIFQGFAYFGGFAATAVAGASVWAAEEEQGRGGCNAGASAGVVCDVFHERWNLWVGRSTKISCFFVLLRGSESGAAACGQSSSEASSSQDGYVWLFDEP